MPPHTHITLQVMVSDFDTMLDSVVDDKRVPIVANVDKVVEYLIEALPQTARQPFALQCNAFLQHVCEAGDEANLIREYLGDMFTQGCNSTGLIKALSALTGKSPIEVSPTNVRAWIAAVAAALNESYLTKPVIAALAYLCEDLPQSEEQFRRLLLSYR